VRTSSLATNPIPLFPLPSLPFSPLYPSFPPPFYAPLRSRLSRMFFFFFFFETWCIDSLVQTVASFPQNFSLILRGSSFFSLSFSFHSLAFPFPVSSFLILPFSKPSFFLMEITRILHYTLPRRLSVFFAFFSFFYFLWIFFLSPPFFFFPHWPSSSTPQPFLLCILFSERLKDLACPTLPGLSLGGFLYVFSPQGTYAGLSPSLLFFFPLLSSVSSFPFFFFPPVCVPIYFVSNSCPLFCFFVPRSAGFFYFSPPPGLLWSDGSWPKFRVIHSYLWVKFWDLSNPFTLHAHFFFFPRVQGLFFFPSDLLPMPPANFSLLIISP